MTGKPIESWLTDMDGVLIHEGSLIPGAAEFIGRLRASGRGFLVLTKNSICTPRDLRALRDPERFDAWLYRLLVNACRDESRRQRRRTIEVHILPLDSPSGRDASADLADRDELERGHRKILFIR